MLQDLPMALEGVSLIKEIVRESIKIANSRLTFLPTGVPRLALDEAVAIASYTYDLGFKSKDPLNEGRDNLYFVLNIVLRDRQGPMMHALKPYLTYLMRGLSKLPAVEERVYRGVPSSSLNIVYDRYKAGVQVHWSAFTSTSTSIAKAKSFAQGRGGVIFRINAVQGRRVAAYSALPNEDEVGKVGAASILFEVSSFRIWGKWILIARLSFHIYIILSFSLLHSPFNPLLPSARFCSLQTRL